MSYILLPNETYLTYFTIFKTLKNDYRFNPLIFNMNFNKPSSKAIIEVLPKVYITKSFFSVYGKN